MYMPNGSVRVHIPFVASSWRAKPARNLTAQFFISLALSLVFWMGWAAFVVWLRMLDIDPKDTFNKFSFLDVLGIFMATVILAYGVAALSRQITRAAAISAFIARINTFVYSVIPAHIVLHGRSNPDQNLIPFIPAGRDAVYAHHATLELIIIATLPVILFIWQKSQDSKHDTEASAIVRGAMAHGLSPGTADDIATLIDETDTPPALVVISYLRARLISMVRQSRDGNKESKTMIAELSSVLTIVSEIETSIRTAFMMDDDKDPWTLYTRCVVAYSIAYLIAIPFIFVETQGWYALISCVVVMLVVLPFLIYVYTRGDVLKHPSTHATTPIYKSIEKLGKSCDSAWNRTYVSNKINNMRISASEQITTYIVIRRSGRHDD